MERQLLSVSGNLFKGEGKLLDYDEVKNISNFLEEITTEHSVELAIVIGGRNMFNASENYIGKNGSSIELLGSVINGLAIRSAMFVQDTNNPRLMTGASIEALAEEYIPRKGIDHLSEGKVVLVTPGVNLPGLDITSVQCAAEFGFTTILKIDPDIPLEEVPKTLSFQQATELNLLNKTSAKMGEELNMSVLVFNDIYELRKVLSGDYSNGILIRG